MRSPFFIKRWFLQGLVLTLPIVTTIIVFYYAIIYTDAILWFIWDLLLWHISKPQFPGLGLIVVTTLVIIIGATTESFLISKIVNWFNQLMSKLPFIRNIYTTVLKVTQHTLGENNTFSKVVMIEYPRKGVYSLAFKTGNNEEVTKQLGHPYVNIFLPTTPIPTNGLYLIMSESDVIETDISPELAFKLILSAGIVHK